MMMTMTKTFCAEWLSGSGAGWAWLGDRLVPREGPGGYPHHHDDEKDEGNDDDDDDDDGDDDDDDP